jgi:alpha-tubulin suppressor-like RCC1 family protein
VENKAKILNFETTPISFSYASTAGIKQDGSLWMWGYNSSANLGDGTTTQRQSPTRVGEDSDWVSVAAGYRHTAAIKSDGTLWAWGINNYGQIGIGTVTPVETPLLPSQVGEDKDWVCVACGGGDGFTMAIKRDGSLWVWGANSYGTMGQGSIGGTLAAPTRLGTGTDWVAVYGGLNTVLALKDWGAIYGWGDDYRGQIGTGSATGSSPATARSLPVRGANLTEGWVALSAGDEHTIALRNDGTVWGWGLNTGGRLGNGNTTSQTLPVRAGTATTWKAIRAGGIHTVGLQNDGSLWAWGSNTYYGLGTGNTTAQSSPFRIGTATDWVAVYAGGGHSGALKPDGTLWVWGNNSQGQLGFGDTGNTDANNRTPRAHSGGWRLPAPL